MRMNRPRFMSVRIDNDALPHDGNEASVSTWTGIRLRTLRGHLSWKLVSASAAANKILAFRGVHGEPGGIRTHGPKIKSRRLQRTLKQNFCAPIALLRQDTLHYSPLQGTLSSLG
jgi:hypothetical protein